MKEIDAKALLVGAKINYLNNSEMLEAIDMGIKALEKQIPIKVAIDYDDEFTCPVCGKTTEDYDVTTLKVCPECGQKLSWD